ncbi:6-phosphogluconolactonase 3 [Trichomonascus vanleenenianus]|uniref:6-phosphogluconolactonase n=1 Tax=Trichomonascus vanleenenianus TaxID=2268995 RepID=UPI003EC97C07
MAPTVYSYAESQQVANALAEHIVKIQNKALAAKPVFNVAVSGGSLVKSLRLGLKDRTDVQWSKWQIFFSDERLVPLAHEDSNYGLLKKELLDHLSEQPTVFTVDESALDNSDLAAERYAEVLRKKVAGEVPALDLVLLGCGPDGHTCSLFPGHKLLQENTKIVASIEDSPKPPPRRITITIPVLKAASHLTFVAEGAGKAPVLQDIFEHPERNLPCSIVNSIGGQVSWFVNDDAIKGVNVTTSQL